MIIYEALLPAVQTANNLGFMYYTFHNMFLKFLDTKYVILSICILT